MTGKAAMAQPAQHIPAYTPARHAEGQFGFGAEGAPSTLARGVWTAHQTVDHLCRPLQGPQMMIAMVANVHVAGTNRTPAVLDIQSNPFEGCPSGPTIRHGRSILVLQFVRCVMSRTHHNIITSCRVKLILAFGRI